MSNLELATGRRNIDDPAFTLQNRVKRGLWWLVWMTLARWTPPPLHRWRVFLLNLCGARVAASAHVYSSVQIWAPWNLEIAPFGSLGRNVQCYNLDRIAIGYKAVVSQGAHLCAGTHDYRDPLFPLIAKAISVGARAWICAGAFVGPGVTVGDGAILGAMGVTLHDLEAWTIYTGNPAVRRRARDRILEENGS